WLNNPMKNVSFDGSPVRFQLDSPLLLCFDPICLDRIRDLVASWPGQANTNVGRLFEEVNARYPAMSCCQIDSFQPGEFMLDPRDIRKFGDEEQDLDYDGIPEDANAVASYPFVAVDSAALMLADSTYLDQLVDLLDWEQYERALQDDTVYSKVS